MVQSRTCPLTHILWRFKEPIMPSSAGTSNKTDYDYRADDGSDLPADISGDCEQHDSSYTINFLDSLTPDTLNIPAAVDQVTADDGSIWEKVSLPGFADRNNTDIVALTPYKRQSVRINPQ